MKKGDPMGRPYITGLGSTPGSEGTGTNPPVSSSLNESGTSLQKGESGEGTSPLHLRSQASLSHL